MRLWPHSSERSRERSRERSGERSGERRARSRERSSSSSSAERSHAPTPPGSKPAREAAAEDVARFVLRADGSHVHRLKALRRQEKLATLWKDMVSGKRRAGARSAAADVLAPRSLLQDYVSREPLPSQANEQHAAEPKLVQKYGKCQGGVLGRGAYGTVRACQKDGHWYAIKEFRRGTSEPQDRYARRLTSEFCIASSLSHSNVVSMLDLFQDKRGDFVEVMEYCAGGDLFTLIVSAGQLTYNEADCFFKQLLRGVGYLHAMGIAHRDLKPENLLLTHDGVLKITDFGNSECFRMAWEQDIHLSGGICGSAPYIPPEEYLQDEFDPRPVDIWACGVIYMAMRTGRQLWNKATHDDKLYESYLNGRKDKNGYSPLESLKRARCRNVIYSMLDPVPSRRLTAKQILNSEWGREIICCHD